LPAEDGPLPSVARRQLGRGGAEEPFRLLAGEEADELPLAGAEQQRLARSA
jgi:hypothetical protein